MTYVLGRASFILDANNEDILRDTARTYAEMKKQANDYSKVLAQQAQVRVSDIKAAASITMDEDRKVAAEQLKAQKQRIAEEKKLAKELEQDTKRALKEASEYVKNEQRDRVARAKRIVQEEKQIEQERLAAVRRTIQEETTLRRQANARRADEAKRARDEERRQSGGGSAGIGGISFNRLGSTSATLLGFGAIASTAVIAHEAIVGVTKAIIEQDEAIRALKASYGAAADAMKSAADEMAATFNRQNAEVEKGFAVFGTLTRQYGVTSEEAKKLAQIAINLQSAFGGTLAEAFRSVGAAIRGEPEALEKYGIAIQENAIKTNRLLTEEEKRLFTSMSAVEQAQIRLRVVFAEGNNVFGAASARTDTLQGAFDKLTRQTDELAKSLGKDLAPAAVSSSNIIADLIERFNKFKTDWDEESRRQNLAIDELEREFRGSPFGFNQNDVIARAREIEQRELDQKNRAVEAAKRHQAQLDAETKARRDQEIENSKFEREGERIITGLKRTAKERIDLLQEQIKAAERAKQVELENLREAEKAELDSLEKRHQAQQEAHRERLEDLRTQRQAELQANEDALEVILLQIQRESDAVKDATDERIRQLEIERDKKIKLAEQNQDTALEALEEEHNARQKAFEQEERALDDSIEREQRKLEDAHKQNLRRIEDEADAERTKYDRAIRNIERQTDREEDRHTRAMRNIEDEADRQKSAIDAQIAGIEAAARARENARRTSSIQSRIGELQRNLTLAQGTGTPEQLSAARNKLSAAIRINDPEAIRKAQEELVAISGKSAAEIEKIQRELAEAQQELIDNNLTQTEDAERQKLEAQKDAIDQQTEREKRAEADRNVRRKRTLDADKQSEKDRLDDALKKIDKRKDELADAYEDDKRGAKDAAENAKRTLQDRRKAEDEHYKAQQEVVRKAYKTERDEIEETYNGEEHGYIPTLRRAEKAASDHFKERERLAREESEKEREHITAVYDDPKNGLIAQQERAQRAVEAAYQLQRDTIGKHYEEARKKVEKAYKADDGKSGIIDKLEGLKDETEANLRKDLEKWEDWKKGLVDEKSGKFPTTFAEAERQYAEFQERMRKRGGIDIPIRFVPNVNNVPGPDPTPGSPGYDEWVERNRRNGGGNSGGGGSSGGSTGGNTTPSGPPPDIGNITSHEVDMNPNRYEYRLGFAKPYNGTYQAAPGWSGGAAWPGGPSHHKGQDLVAPEGTPVGAFAEGTVKRTVAYSGNPYKDPAGNYIVIEGAGGRTHWYMHLQKFADGVSAGRHVNRGNLIGFLGKTGTEDINYPHLHYEVRQGDNNGPMSLEALRKYGIDPVPYIKGYDSGTLFRHPTLTFDTHTGEQGILAERGPEQLLGRVATGALYSSMRAGLNLEMLGASMLKAPVTNNTNNTQSGDQFFYNGVAPDNIIDRWRDDQRRQRVLRG